MGMAEIRDAFEAYASGELAEYELRSALRAEIQTQPGSVHRYAAMAAALRRRNLISAELEAAVVSDMQAAAGQDKPATQNSPESEEQPTRASARASREPPPLDPPLDPPLSAPAPDVSRPSVPVAVSTGSGVGRSASRGGAWDTKERLAEPESPVGVGLVLRERFELI